MSGRRVVLLFAALAAVLALIGVLFSAPEVALPSPRSMEFVVGILTLTIFVIVVAVRIRDTVIAGPLLVKAAASGKLPAVEAVLRMNPGAGVIARTTALFAAAQQGHASVARVLLQRGARQDLPAEEGWTPLMWASWSGSEPVVRLLLEHGAELDRKNEAGYTALMVAAYEGHVGVVKLLLDAGADFASGERWAFMAAVAGGHLEMVRLFLSRGANVHFRDSDGDTPLSLSIQYGHPDIEELLRQHGAREQ